MKKAILSVMAVLLVGCATPTINQVEYYGVVEDTVYYGGHHHAKVWCAAKGKYYDVVTDRLYQVGDVIRIK